jgi:predicted RNA-binding protein with TRAM domain
MVNIPDSLQSLFTGTVEERDGRYYIEIPKSEIEHEAARPGQTYRIAVLPDDRSDATGTESTGSERSAESDGQRPEPPVDEGEIRTVTVESVGDQGDGIAKVERGYVVIVPEAEPGEEPTVEIEQVKQNVAFARVVDEPSV